MRRKDNFWKIIILIVVSFFLINLFISTLLVKNRVDQKKLAQNFLELRDQISFSYTPKHDNLNIFVIPFRNKGLMNKDFFKFRIYLDNKVIREVDFSGFNIGEVSDIRFQFTPIKDSKNKEFKIEIVHLSSSENPVLVGVSGDATLAYTSYYKTSDKIKIVLETFSRWLERIRDDLGFFVIWTIFLLGSIFLFKKYGKV